MPRTLNTSAGLRVLNTNENSFAGPEYSTDSQLFRGFRTSDITERANALIWDAAEAEKNGDEEGALKLKATAKMLLDEAQKVAPRVGQFTDIESAGDVADWAAQGLGSAARSTLKPIVGGLAGAAAGSVAGPVGSLVGGIAGAFGGGYDMQANENMAGYLQDKDLKDRPIQELQDRARLTAVPQAALDSIVPAKEAVLAFKGAKELTKLVGKKALAKRAAIDALEEGGTETLQGMTGDYSQADLAGRDYVFDGTKAINDFAGGAIGGLGFGGAGAVHQFAKQGVSSAADKVSEIKEDPLGTVTDGLTAASGGVGRGAASLWENGKDWWQERSDRAEARKLGVPYEQFHEAKYGEDGVLDRLKNGGPKDPTNFTALTPDEVEQAKTDPVAVETNIKARADALADKIITDSVANPKNYLKGEREAAVAYKSGQIDYTEFQAQLRDTVKGDALQNIVTDLESKLPKQSKLGMTEEGVESSKLADFWAKRNSQKYPLFQHAEGPRAATMLMHAVRTGMEIPQSVIGQLEEHGVDPVAVVKSMGEQIAQHDEGFKNTALEALRKEVQDKNAASITGSFKSDEKVIEDNLTDMAKEGWDSEKSRILANRLTRSKATSATPLTPKMKAALRELFGAKLGAVYQHFAAKADPSYGKSAASEGAKSDEAKASGAMGETGSDAVTDNDGDWNSGVNELPEAPKETLKLHRYKKSSARKLTAEQINSDDKESASLVHNAKVSLPNFYDIADPDALTDMIAKRDADGKIEEMGAADYAHVTGGEPAVRALIEVLASQGEISRPTGKRWYTKAFNEINSRYKALVTSTFEDGGENVTKDNVKSLRVSATKYDPVNKSEVATDTSDNGRVFIELEDGKTFLTSAKNLTRLGSNGIDVAGESAELAGQKRSEMGFKAGMSKVLAALKDSGENPTGRVGVKTEAGGEIQWSKSGMPTGLRLTDKHVIQHQSLRKQTGEPSPSKKWSDLGLSDISEMSSEELVDLHVKIEDKLGKVKEEKAGVFSELQDQIAGVKVGISKAKDKESLTLRQERLKELEAKLSESRAKSKKYESLKDRIALYEEQLDKISGERDGRLEKSSGGEISHYYGDVNPVIGGTDTSVIPGERNYRADTRVTKNDGSFDHMTVTEGDEMTAQAVKKEDNTPIIRSEDDGTVAVTEPTDTDGYWKGANSKWEDVTKLNPADVRARIWVSDMLKNKGVAATVKALKATSELKRARAVEMLKSKFWQGSIYEQHSDVFKRRAEKVLSALTGENDERGQVSGSGQEVRGDGSDKKDVTGVSVQTSSKESDGVVRGNIRDSADSAGRGDSAADRNAGKSDQNRRTALSEQSPGDATADTTKEAVSEIKRLLGDTVEALFNQDLKGAAGEWLEQNGKNLIRIATGSNALGAAHHESVHEFFNILTKHGAESVVKAIEGLHNNKMLMNQLDRLLNGHQAAQDQVRNSPEEAAAFFFQFWKAGEIKMGPKGNSLFNMVKDFLLKVASIFSDTVRKHYTEMKTAELQEEYLQNVMQSLDSGDFSNADKAIRQSLVDTMKESTELYNKAQKSINEGYAKMVNMVGHFVMSNEAAIEAAGSKYLINLSRMFNQKAGEAMRRIRPANDANPDLVRGALFDAVRRETSMRMNQLNNILRKYDEDDMKLAREGLSKNVRPTAQKAGQLYDEIWGNEDSYLRQIGKYMGAMDVRRLQDGMWEPVQLRKEYGLPQVWDTAFVMEHSDEFKADLWKHHKKEIEELAAKSKSTPQDIVDAIVSSVMNNGTEDLQESASELGFTPAASAVNRRTLNWLDKTAFDKYKSTNLVGILSNYTHSIIKRAEYQSRFGYDGNVVQEAADKAIINEVGGKEMIDKAQALHDKEVNDWSKERLKAKQLLNKDPNNKAAQAALKVKKPTLREAGRSLMTPEQYEGAIKKLEVALKGVQALEGTLGADISPETRALNSWVNTYQNFRTLPLMLFTSFADVNNVLVQGRSLSEAWDTFVSGIKAIKDSWTGAEPDEMMLRAEMWGGADAASFAETLGEAYGSNYMTGKTKKLNDQFFKWTAAEGWNRGIRAAATHIAEKVLLEMKSGKYDMSNPAQKAMVERLFGKGFDPSEIVVDEQGAPDINDQANRAAVQRWVLDTMVTPNAAHRPAWASDPHYAMFMHLKNFTYTMHRVILKGAIEQAKLGNYQPIMAHMLGAAPIMIVSGAIKEMLIPGDEPKWMKGGLNDVVAYGFDRAGPFGIGQMYAQNLWPGKHFDPAAAVGPMADEIQGLGSMMIGQEGHSIPHELLGDLPFGVLARRLAD